MFEIYVEGACIRKPLFPINAVVNQHPTKGSPKHVEWHPCLILPAPMVVCHLVSSIPVLTNQHTVTTAVLECLYTTLQGQRKNKVVMKFFVKNTNSSLHIFAIIHLIPFNSNWNKAARRGWIIIFPFNSLVSYIITYKWKRYLGYNYISIIWLEIFI